MYRTVPYIVLFLILALLQIFCSTTCRSVSTSALWSISASLSCCRSTLRRLQCFFWLCRCPLRWIGRWGQRGSIRSLRFRSLCCAGRFCSLSAVRRGFGRVVFLLRSGWGRADFCATWQRWSWYTTSCFHVGVPVLGAVVPYARPTGREQCCYGGLHLAACAAVHH